MHVIPVGLSWAGLAGALAQIVMIDLTLAGDNAVAVGLAAAGLPPERRHLAMVLGLGCSAIMLAAFALVAKALLDVLGLRLAGGLLLLWVCWRMWRDLRARRPRDAGGAAPRAKTLAQSLFQILATDLSMSLDNVLAITGAARHQPAAVLFFGLLLSIVLTGFAAAAIARLIGRAPWIGYIGLAIVVFVAGQMIWEGSIQVGGRI
ncbi:MAG: YjbE family putative metal transport protein [Caulobacteraceae bacterium]